MYRIVSDIYRHDFFLLTRLPDVLIICTLYIRYEIVLQKGELLNTTFDASETPLSRILPYYPCCSFITDIVAQVNLTKILRNSTVSLFAAP